MPQPVVGLQARVGGLRSPGLESSRGQRRLRRAALAAWLVTASVVALLPALASGAAEDAELLGSNPEADDQFGLSVAVSDAPAGSVAVVGSSFEDGGPQLIESGAVYVFRNNGTGWASEQRLTASDADAGDQFGGAVAVEGDVAVVGADRDEDNGIESGSAYVFRYNGMTWDEEEKISAFIGAPGDSFGFSVAVSDHPDGTVAVVGALKDDVTSFDQGSVYVFRNSGMGWEQEQRLVASNGLQGDEFGGSVAVSSSTAVVGADLDDDDGTDSGSAYVFFYFGTAWVQETQLNASDAVAGDQFGFSVAISGDTIVVGAPKKAVDGDSAAGAAYVFRLGNLTGLWEQEAILTESNGSSQNQFGISVAVSGDTAVIGADAAGGVSGGSAYVFRRTGTTWAEQEILDASDVPSSAELPGDSFGISVSVSSDTAVVGARFHVHDAVDAGAAYVFSVPEPSAALLTATALLTLVATRRRSG